MVSAVVGSVCYRCAGCILSLCDMDIIAMQYGHHRCGVWILLVCGMDAIVV